VITEPAHVCPIVLPARPKSCVMDLETLRVRQSSPCLAWRECVCVPKGCGMKPRDILIAFRNLAAGSSVYSLKFLSHPRTMVSYVSECLFLGRQFNGNSNGALPAMNVWDYFHFDANVSIALDGKSSDSDWFRSIASYTVDLVAMCMLCQMLRPKVVFEIGTYHGAGALHWAMNAPEANIYTLDLPPNQQPQLKTTSMDQYHIGERYLDDSHMAFSGRREASRIHRLTGDSLLFDYSPYLKSVDLFFVDGAHSYEYVSADTENAFKCCRPGGVIVWHDYGRVGVNGVSRRLEELAAQGHPIKRIPGGSIAYLQLPQ
jgi:predicted O-methyltransferase YrrM